MHNTKQNNITVELRSLIISYTHLSNVLHICFFVVKRIKIHQRSLTYQN